MRAEFIVKFVMFSLTEKVDIVIGKQGVWTNVLHDNGLLDFVGEIYELILIF